MKIGCSTCDITPRAGIRMGGYGKRIQPALGVSDALQATALVAENNGTTIAMVSCDLSGISEKFLIEIRGHLEHLTGIPGQHIMVCATHTHYGPESANRDDAAIDSYDAAYRANLSYQLAGLVQEAQLAMMPARISMAQGESQIGVNRREKMPDGRIVLGRNPNGPIDRTLTVFRMESMEEVPIAALVSFATHPVCQDPQLRMISADYVGFARRMVEAKVGAPCVFWQGTAGDINPLRAEGAYENARALGTTVGGDVLKLWPLVKPLASDVVAVINRTVELPAYRGLSLVHAEGKVQEAEADLDRTRRDPHSTPGLIDWWEKQVVRWQKLKASWTDPKCMAPPVRMPLQAFRIGSWAWVCVPGELFTEVGLQIKARSPFSHTLVVAYANGYFGYLPAWSAFEEGGYEIDAGCKVAPDGITRMVDNLVAMLNELKAVEKKQEVP